MSALCVLNLIVSWRERLKFTRLGIRGGFGRSLRAVKIYILNLYLARKSKLRKPVAQIRAIEILRRRAAIKFLFAEVLQTSWRLNLAP